MQGIIFSLFIPYLKTLLFSALPTFPHLLFLLIYFNQFRSLRKHQSGQCFIETQHDRGNIRNYYGLAIPFQTVLQNEIQLAVS